MSRALLNNQKVVDFIKANFVPVNAAVEDLQPDRYGGHVSAQAKWFEPVARRALKDFGPPGFFERFKSYQGMYVVGADGTPYEFKVGQPFESQYFIGVLERALKKYKTMPHAKMAKSAKPAEQALAQIDQSISVVRVFSRICPVPAHATISERSLGRDHMWIMRDEVDELIRMRDIGKTYELPSTLKARLVRFQLLNHVGNIMGAFSETQVKKATFPVRKISERGDLLSFVFSGEYSSYAPPGADDSGEGSLEGNLNGEFDIDKKTRKIARFRAYGEAVSVGRNESLAKNRKYQVLFAMIDANDQIARTVTPFWAAIPMFAPVYKKPEIKKYSI